MSKLLNFKSSVGGLLGEGGLGEKKTKKEEDKDGESKAGEREGKEEGGGGERTEVGTMGWQDALDDYDDSDWLGTGGGLTFTKDTKMSFLQREMEDDDSLATYDPLKAQKEKINDKITDKVRDKRYDRERERDHDRRNRDRDGSDRDRDRDRDRGGRDRDRDRDGRGRDTRDEVYSKTIDKELAALGSKR